MKVSITGQFNSQLPPSGRHLVVELGPEPLNTTVTVALDQDKSACDRESLKFTKDVSNKQAVKELANTGRSIEALFSRALTEPFQIQLIELLGVHDVASK